MNDDSVPLSKTFERRYNRYNLRQKRERIKNNRTQKQFRDVEFDRILHENDQNLPFARNASGTDL